jgi:hypothetical protein
MENSPEDGAMGVSACLGPVAEMGLTNFDNKVKMNMVFIFIL